MINSRVGVKLHEIAAMRTAITAVVGSILCSKSAALVVPLRAARPAQALDIALPRVIDGASVHLGDALSATTDKTLLVLGTHTADFNAIEYLQRYASTNRGCAPPASA